MARASSNESELRTDAQRNVELIRQAAVIIFRDRGFGVPLGEVAAAAGVSKATIFNRFGGRAGLIESVVEEVIAAELNMIIGQTRSIADADEQLASYITTIRDLQFRQPAANDLLLQQFPHSTQLLDICHSAGEIYDELVSAGHEAKTLRPDFTADDLHALVVDNALALKYGRKPRRSDYDRRTAFVLAGIQTLD